MRLAFVGSGYVGLVSGACLASLGHDVTCVDNDVVKIEALKAGRVPIREPGLDELVAATQVDGKLRFTDRIADSVIGAEAVFLTVGTPSRTEDGEAELSHVFTAVDAISDYLDDGVVLVSKSTVPVGTGDVIAARIASRRSGHGVSVVSCPEFLREGTAIEDFMDPYRIVIGTDSERAERALREIYGPLIDRGTPCLVMSRRSAELSKYAANSFLATKLAFINEMADFAETVSADIEEVIKAIGHDPRIGRSYLGVGPGFGGSCFPKDAMALHRNSEETNSTLRIVETVIAVNDRRKRNMANRVLEACGGSVDGYTVAILGVTFKPDTDDIRDAPSIPIVRRLSARGAIIRLFDPAYPSGGAKDPAFDGLPWSNSVVQALEGADAAVIVTDWPVIKEIDLYDVAKRMNAPRLIDLRNLFEPAAAAAAGIDYTSLGRPTAHAITIEKNGGRQNRFHPSAAGHEEDTRSSSPQ